MATASTSRNLCDTCSKAKGISKCEGCAKVFCYVHFGDHRQELNQQLEEVEVSRDVFRQTLTEQTTNPGKHALVQQINDWERDAIKRIRKTADEARQSLLSHTTKYISEIEVKLNKLTDQLRQSRQESDFVETDLQHWKQQLIQLNTELCEPSHITLRHDLKPFVTRIFVDISEGKCVLHIHTRMEDDETAAKDLFCKSCYSITAEFDALADALLLEAI